MAAEHVRVVLAAVDDLHVVDRDDRQPVIDAVEVAPGLEVADHDVGAEVVGDVEVRLDVLRPAAGERALQVRQQGAEVPHLVVLGDDGEAPDFSHLELLAGPFGEVVVGAAGDDDLHLVLLDQFVEHHARTDRVSHTLAHDAVKNPHQLILSRTSGLRGGGASPSWTAARRRSSPASRRDSVAACSSARTSPSRTWSPTRFCKRSPAAGSTTSSLRARPAPSSTAARPTSSASNAVRTPLRSARTSRTSFGCGSCEGLSTTEGSPPWASINCANRLSAAPSASAVSSRIRASSGSLPTPGASPAMSISTPSRRVRSRTSCGPAPRRMSIDSRTSTALPTALPSGASMSVRSATQPRPSALHRSTMVR